MASIAHSMAHELDITIRNLEEANQHLVAARAEITSLEDEVARLRQHMPSEFKTKPPISSPPKHRFQNNSIGSSIPRYAKATQASERRSVKLKAQAQHAATVHVAITSSVQSTSCSSNDQKDCAGAIYSNKYQHQVGSLAKEPAGYLKATKSSAAKMCSKIPRRTVDPEVKLGHTQLEGDPQTWWNDASGSWATVHEYPEDGRWATYEDKHGKRWSLGWLHAVELSPHKLSDTEYRDLMDLHVLVPATRLEDDKWRESPLKHMFIDDGKQAQLLIQGRETAQKCLWNFAEQQMPGQNPWACWQQVRFEWGVLSQTWGTASTYYGSLKFRATQPHLVWDTMQKLIQLRHTTSHYSPSSDLFPSSLSEVDEHLKNVQKMAIQLYDKQGALEARRLRDELRQSAQHTFDELVALGMLVSLPFAGYPWKNHHESVFRCFLFNARDRDEEETKVDDHFPRSIGGIAEDWLLQHGWRGSGYEPPVSLAASPGTRTKRRHSTCSHQSFEKVPAMAARIKTDWGRQQRDGCEALCDVPEWLVEAHEQGVSTTSPLARRRLSF